MVIASAEFQETNTQQETPEPAPDKATLRLARIQEALMQETQSSWYTLTDDPREYLALLIDEVLMLVDAATSEDECKKGLAAAFSNKRWISYATLEKHMRDCHPAFTQEGNWKEKYKEAINAIIDKLLDAE